MLAGETSTISASYVYAAPMDYKPGDVANGHMLGADGVWHPVGLADPPQMTMRLDRSGYWARYLRRWMWTWLAVSSTFALVTLVGGIGYIDNALGAGSLVMGILMSYLCGGLFVGTVVNFAVAALPSRRI